jgi:hypothetical protein
MGFEVGCHSERKGSNDVDGIVDVRSNYERSFVTKSLFKENHGHQEKT